MTQQSSVGSQNFLVIFVRSRTSVCRGRRKFCQCRFTIINPKFGYVVSELPSTYAVEARGTMMQPLTNNKYVKLKQELVKCLCALEEE